MERLTSGLPGKVIEHTSRPASKITQALKDAMRNAMDVAKSMSSAGATDRFTKSMASLKVKAEDLRTITKAWRAYAKAQDLAAHASQWTKAHANDIRQWESQTISAIRSTRREQQQPFKHPPDVANRVHPIAHAMSANTLAGRRIISGMSEFGRVRDAGTEVNKTNHSGQNGHSPNRDAKGGGLGSAALGFVLRGVKGGAAGLVFDAVKASIRFGAERQHVRVAGQNAGVKPDELKRAEAASIAATKDAPNLSATEILKLYENARSAVIDPKDAVQLIPQLAKAGSVLKGMGVDSADISELIKSAASIGVTNDPKRFESFLDGQVKSLSAIGKTISADQISEAKKYQRLTGSALSDRFLNAVLPTLNEEMNDSSAGEAVAQVVQTFRGGLRKNPSAVMQLNKLGLLEDRDKIVRKNGRIVGYTGKIKGDELLSTDLDQWVHDVFKPAAERTGRKEASEQIRLLEAIFPKDASDLARSLIQKEETIKTRGELYSNAATVEQARANLTHDPKAAMNELEAAADDLATAVTSTLPLAEGLHAASTGIREVGHSLSGLESLREASPLAQAEKAAREEAAKQSRRATYGDVYRHLWGEIEKRWEGVNKILIPEGPGVSMFDRYSYEKARPMTVFARVEGAAPHFDAKHIDGSKIGTELNNTAVNGLNLNPLPKFTIGAPYSRINDEPRDAQSDFQKASGEPVRKPIEPIKKRVKTWNPLEGTGAREVNARNAHGKPAYARVQAGDHVGPQGSYTAKVKAAIKALNVTVRPKVDQSSLQSALGLLKAINAEIARVNGGISGLALEGIPSRSGGAHGARVPPLGKRLRGDFSTAGDPVV